MRKPELLCKAVEEEVVVVEDTKEDININNSNSRVDMVDHKLKLPRTPMRDIIK